MPLTPELAELADRVRNWGRWGDDDQRGTANLIDAAASKRGAASVRSGRTFDLTVPLGAGSPQKGGAPGRFHPMRWMISINETYMGNVDDAHFNDDVVSMPLAGGTHLDGLAHVSYSGKLYNGFDADTVTASGGASKAGADKIGPVVTRGVLLDVARVKGVDRLELGYAITEADLDAAVGQAGVELQSGDALLVRTGQMQFLHDGDQWAYNHDSAGLSTGTIEWVHRHDVGAIVTDTYVLEVWPPQDWGAMMAVHMIHLRDMGQVQGQNFDLEALAVDCATDGQYDFLFTANPEPIPGACSAPVAAVAVK